MSIRRGLTLVKARSYDDILWRLLFVILIVIDSALMLPWLVKEIKE